MYVCVCVCVCVQILKITEENDMAKEQLDAQHKQMLNDKLKVKILEDQS